MNRVLLGVVLALVAAILGLLAWMVMSGLTQPQAPRTSVERDILQAEAQLKVKPKDEDAWKAYVAALVAAGRYGDARDAVNRGEAALGKLPAFALASGQVYRAQGDLGKALAEAKRAAASALKLRAAKVKELAEKGVAPDPKTLFGEELIDAEVLTAEIEIDLGKLDEGVAAYTRALEQSPVMADVLAARGDLYAKMKRYGEARADYTKALSFGADYQPAIDGLEKLKAVSGQ